MMLRERSIGPSVELPACVSGRSSRKELSIVDGADYAGVSFCDSGDRGDLDGSGVDAEDRLGGGSVESSVRVSAQRIGGLEGHGAVRI